MPNSTPAIERFWKRVIVVDDPGACWEWNGAHIPNGYGSFAAPVPGVSQMGAHRYSWEIHNGPIPDGLFVCHRCDNKGCVRPSHLFLGTNSENLMDASAKGRIASGDRNGARLYPDRLKPSHGETHYLAKLNQAQVDEIRALYAAGGISQSALGLRFGVGRATIGAITTRRNWKH